MIDDHKLVCDELRAKIRNEMAAIYKSIEDHDKRRLLRKRAIQAEAEYLALIEMFENVK